MTKRADVYLNFTNIFTRQIENAPSDSKTTSRNRATISVESAHGAIEVENMLIIVSECSCSGGSTSSIQSCYQRRSIPNQMRDMISQLELQFAWLAGNGDERNVIYIHTMLSASL